MRRCPCPNNGLSHWPDQSWLWRRLADAPHGTTYQIIVSEVYSCLKLGFEERFTARQDNSGIVILGNASAELVALIKHRLAHAARGDTAGRLQLILERLVRLRGPQAEER